MRKLIPLFTWITIIVVGCVAPAAQPYSPLQFAGTLPEPHRYSVYLPYISNVVPTATPIPPPTPAVMPDPCGGGDLRKIVEALIEHEGQQREALYCNPSLMIAAQRRAQALAERFDHCDARNVCANVYARVAGCGIPDYYGDINSIESITAGSWSWRASLDALLNSPSHRAHLLAEDDFYKTQDQIGVGYAFVPNSRWKFHWVILTAECN